MMNIPGMYSDEYFDENVRIIDSARKHAKKQKISDEDIMHVLKNPEELILLEEYQNKLLYLGYDASVRELEAITVENVDGEILVIHAMKVRKSTLDLIKGLKYEK